MPLNLLKKYNELLDLLSMPDQARTASLKGVFNRDILNNPEFAFQGKPIYPTPKENGMAAMKNLFNHLTRKEVDKENKHREFDIKRSERLHWIKYHIGMNKVDDMLYFSVAEPRSVRTYIYDIVENYVIVLEPLRNGRSYYLLTAYYLEGKDAARKKIIRKYKTRRLPNIL